MANGSHKKAKIEQALIRDINTILRSQSADPRLQFLSVTKVNVSTDYAYAEVYWDTYDSSKRKECEAAISTVKGRIRSILAKNLKIRHTPELRFQYDEQYEAEKSITDLLKSEKDEGRKF